MHDGLAALHEAATSPERQARALSSALPSWVASAALPFYQDAPSGPQVNYNFIPHCCFAHQVRLCLYEIKSNYCLLTP